MTNETIVNGQKYATNDYEEGLFVWAKRYNQPFAEWVQLVGTCDFSVKKIKYNKNKKAKIRKVVLDGEIRETY